jgi:hypothetical protein
MAPWEQLSALMDGKIDEVLGDGLTLSRGGGAFKPLQGFVITAAEPQNGDADYLDPILGVRKRVKVQLAVLELKEGDRVRHPKLGAGTWKILGPEPDEATQGRYLIADVQKAGA